MPKLLDRRSAALAWPAVALTMAPLLAAPAFAQQPGAPRVEVHEATVAELQAAMQASRVTAVELVDAYLARIQAYDRNGPALNSLIRVNPKARAEAAALDQERAQRGPRGPLHGIPVILKDNYDTEDLPTSGGSIALAGQIPPDDAFVVRRLREAGAIILGKANMHELAAGITTISSLGGQTRNPYDPRRCPGGSSGGTGAAIAASLATIGWGTDTCGSIRIPAAYGSLVGIRPTQGLVSRDGIIPLSHTQDIGGPMTRTVADLAVALDVTVGYDPADPATQVMQDRPRPSFTGALRTDALRGARLGVLRNYFSDTDGNVARVVRAAADAMKALGAEVVEVSMPDFDSLVAGSRVVDFETKFDLLDYFGANPTASIRSMSDILARGLYHVSLENRFRRIEREPARETEERSAVLAKQVVLRDAVVRLLDSLRLDALIYPTMKQKPVLIGDPQVGVTCQLSAHAGLPAITVPAGYTDDGLPVGVELLGRPFADDRLVGLAYSFEQAGPRRLAPATTPPLVNGRAPAPAVFDVSAGDPEPLARGRFTYDAPRGELGYVVQVTGGPADQVHGLVLREGTADMPGPIVYRLSGPGVTTASGTIPLTGMDRERLVRGRLLLSVLTTSRLAQGSLVVPR